MRLPFSAHPMRTFHSAQQRVAFLRYIRLPSPRWSDIATKLHRRRCFCCRFYYLLVDGLCAGNCSRDLKASIKNSESYHCYQSSCCNKLFIWVDLLNCLLPERYPAAARIPVSPQGPHHRGPNTGAPPQGPITGAPSQGPHHRGPHHRGPHHRGPTTGDPPQGPHHRGPPQGPPPRGPALHKGC